MLQKLSNEIRECYGHAAEARRKADAATAAGPVDCEDDRVWGNEVIGYRNEVTQISRPRRERPRGTEPDAALREQIKMPATPQRKGTTAGSASFCRHLRSGRRRRGVGARAIALRASPLDSELVKKIIARAFYRDRGHA